MYATRISILAAHIEEQAAEIETVRDLMPEFEQTAEDTVDWWRSRTDELFHEPISV